MGKRKIYNTTLDSELTKAVRILAAQLGKRQNDLLEEAIQDLLKKYIQDLKAPLLEVVSKPQIRFPA